MFDHRISIEDKLRDLCLLSVLSLPFSPSPLLTKYKTEMTTISQHYVARAARLEMITRESLCNAHSQDSEGGSLSPRILCLTLTVLNPLFTIFSS